MSNKVNDTPSANRCAGLDNLLGGGLPEFSFNLIAGDAGKRKNHARSPDHVLAGNAGLTGRCSSRCSGNPR